MIALDVETTGKDFGHGALPFFVTVCEPDGTQRWWEWEVDPLTRNVIVPEEDIEVVREAVAADEIVGQNIKFDAIALHRAGIVPDWPWERTHDTLLMGHLLASNQPHDLTTMTLTYLGIDLQPYEDRLRQACHEARRFCRSKLPHWRIAGADQPDMPSVAKGGKDRKGQGDEDEKPWKYDSWLPRTLARYLGHKDDHPWHSVLAEYSNSDSAATIALWQAMSAEIKRRGYWEIYQTRRQLLPVLMQMHLRGVTLSSERMDELADRFRETSAESEAICAAIAESVGVEDFQLAKSGMNNQMRRMLFGTTEEGGQDAMLPLPILKTSDKTGEPSLDKEVLRDLLLQLSPRTKQYAFLKALQAKRKVDPAINYMDGYRRFWLPNGSAGTYILHPDINPCATAHLRFGCHNPNGQNVSKQEDYNIRYCFGPAPGREWWALDYKNIERRIPAYEAGETEIIALFERPDDPPHYGSEHSLVASILHPDLFAECGDGKVFKERYKATWYQRIKNGNFAMQYGSGDRNADKTFGVEGAALKIRSRFAGQAKLNQHMLSYASKWGFVETIPDKTVDPKHGYPILCARTERGGIKPTTPLNYHTSGTAMWCMIKAMIRVEAKLVEWRAAGFDGWMILNVHDELLFDFPLQGDPVAESKRVKEANGKATFRTSNLWRVEEVRRLMELSGDDIGIPTPVDVTYHPVSWDKGIGIS